MNKININIININIVNESIININTINTYMNEININIMNIYIYIIDVNNISNNDQQLANSFEFARDAWPRSRYKYAKVTIPHAILLYRLRFFTIGHSL